MELKKFNIFVKLVVVFVTVLYSTVVQGLRGCVFNITDVGNYAPVLLWNTSTKYELAIPEMGLVRLNFGEDMNLACPGPKNNITLTNSKYVTGTCSQNNQLKVFNQGREFEELKCKKIVRGDIKKTNRNCAHGSTGKFVFIGYQMTNSEYFPLISVCYDENNGNTLYTEHKIYGRALNNPAKLANKPSFSVDGLGPKITAAAAYEKVVQKATFNRLLGSASLAENYISSKSYLARGHLSPVADFPLATSKIATYFYINAVPQWQTINQANWKSLESMVRKTAENYEELRIITGTYGTLTLPDQYGEETEIYLQSQKRLPVPKYIWKVLYDETSQDGIALIVLNNPFVTQIFDNDFLCDENLCDSNGWGSTSWNTLKSGFVHCCSLKEFRKTVKTVPRLVVNGVLQGISSYTNIRKRPKGV